MSLPCGMKPSPKPGAFRARPSTSLLSVKLCNDWLRWIVNATYFSS